VGDEGGFAPSIQSNYEGVDLLMEAIKLAGIYIYIYICMYVYISIQSNYEGVDLLIEAIKLAGNLALC
jgi:enolase